MPDDAWYLVGEKTFWQPKKERDDFQGQEPDMINHNNLESELLERPKELLKITFDSKENLCQSGQTQALQMLYPGQITYKSTAISSKLLDGPKHSDQSLDTRDTPFSLA